MTPSTPFTKTVEMQFARDGKRTKLAGFVGQITDESGVVLHSQLYNTKPEAEQALDALVHGLLVDYADRGLVDTLPEAPVTEVNWGSGPSDLAAAHVAAQGLANVIQAPVYVVGINNSYLVQDDQDLACYGGIGAILATYQPATPRAVSLQSLAIDSKIVTCKNCQGIHSIQLCPEIAAALFAPAPWKDIALGRELCRMRWRDFKAFAALLLSVTPDALLAYAASYQAFVRDYAPDSDLTINDVLKVWGRIISDEGGRGPAMQVAA